MPAQGDGNRQPHAAVEVLQDGTSPLPWHHPAASPAHTFAFTSFQWLNLTSPSSCQPRRRRRRTGAGTGSASGAHLLPGVASGWPRAGCEHAELQGPRAPKGPCRCPQHQELQSLVLTYLHGAAGAQAVSEQRSVTGGYWESGGNRAARQPPAALWARSRDHRDKETRLQGSCCKRMVCFFLCHCGNLVVQQVKQLLRETSCPGIKKKLGY